VKHLVKEKVIPAGMEAILIIQKECLHSLVMVDIVVMEVMQG